MVGQNKLESRGRISKDDLLVLTSLDQLLLMVIKYINFNYKRCYLNEVVYCTKPSPSVGVACRIPCKFFRAIPIPANLADQEPGFTIKY
jgi:hypothetical protein